MPLESTIDGDLLTKVMLALQQHSSSTRLVTANVVRGIVVLTGQVVSFHHRQLCIAAALKVQGVARVDDQLDVVEIPQREIPKRSAGSKNGRELIIK